jgi:hypothetical protein
MFLKQQHHLFAWLAGNSFLWVLMLLLSAFLVGCGPSTVANTSSSTSTAALQPITTATDLPSPTATSLPACVTPTPLPTSSAQPTPIAPNGWATFTDSVYHYSVEYPANWLVPSGLCSGNALDVYNYDSLHVGSTPPPGGHKLEVLPMDNPSQLSATDFYTQLKQQPGFPACPAETAQPMTVGGHNALEVSCPAHNNVVFYVPDGQTMLAGSRVHRIEWAALGSPDAHGSKLEVYQLGWKWRPRGSLFVWMPAAARSGRHRLL